MSRQSSRPAAEGARDGRSRRRRPWSRVSAGAPPSIPTMITSEEKSYVYWLTREEWSGVSDVVEVGPWLGGSTWFLASGMEANRHASGAKLHVIDDFRWRPFMAERARLPLAPGASFRSYFERNLKAKRKLLVIHEAALPDDRSLALVDEGGHIASDPGLPVFSGVSIPGQIGIVFVDGAKSWSALLHLLRELAPRFIPGETVLVFQDFQYWLAYWVPMALAAVSQSCPGALTHLHTLRANSVSFRVQTAIDPEDLSALPNDVEAISLSDGRSLLREAGQMLEGWGDHVAARIVELGEVAFLGSRGAWDEALERFAELEARWPLAGPLNQLTAAREWLARHAGVNLTPSPRARRIASWLRVRNAVSRRFNSFLRRAQ